MTTNERTAPVNDHQLIFVGGLHRSGTTPLARALASHPLISGLSDTGAREDEGQHIQDVYPKIGIYGGVGRFAMSANAHLTEASPLVSSSNAHRLLRCWEPYWDLRLPYLVEKSPSNLIISRFLQALYPEASLIMILRNPIVVALATRKWTPKLISRRGRGRVGLTGLVEHWLRAHELFLDDLEHLRRVHVVYYEDLVTRPTEELARIQRFLGLRSEIPSDTLRRGLGDRYLVEWQRILNGNPLERRARRRIETDFKNRIARFGYDTADLTSHGRWVDAV